jgi:hypothetical protein
LLGVVGVVGGVGGGGLHGIVVLANLHSLAGHVYSRLLVAGVTLHFTDAMGFVSLLYDV